MSHLFLTFFWLAARGLGRRIRNVNSHIQRSIKMMVIKLASPCDSIIFSQQPQPEENETIKGKKEKDNFVNNNANNNNSYPKFVCGVSSLNTEIWDGGVVLYDDPTSSLPKYLNVATGVTSVAFLGEKGDHIVCSCDDGSLGLWFVLKTKEKLVRYLLEHHDTATSVSSHPIEKNSFISSSFDATIKTWEITSTSSTGTFIGHTNYIWKVEWNKLSPNIFLSCSEDKTSKIWDRREGNKKHGVVATIVSPKFPVFTVTWSHFSEHVLAIGEADGTVKVYDCRKIDAPTATYRGHIRATRSLAFSPHNEHLLASGSDDKTVAIWDLKSNAKVYENKAHTDFVRALAWNPSKEGVLATGSWDKSVIFHDIGSTS